MDEITLFLVSLIAGISSLLFVVSIAAYLRLRKLKLFLVSLAFLAFVIKGFLLIMETLAQGRLGLIIDVIILVLLYFAVIKK